MLEVHQATITGRTLTCRKLHPPRFAIRRHSRSFQKDRVNGGTQPHNFDQLTPAPSRFRERAAQTTGRTGNTNYRMSHFRNEEIRGGVQYSPVCRGLAAVRTRSLPS